MKEINSLTELQTDDLFPPHTGRSFGDVLQTYRSRSHMSQAGLAELLGTSRNTVNNWENGRNKPDYEIIRMLVKKFHIPLYELFDLESEVMPAEQEVTVLRQYRLLNDTDKRIAEGMLEVLLKEEENARARQLRDSYRIIPLEATPAAAGVGCLEVEIPPAPCFVLNTDVSRRADALIRVSGCSMEPRYLDGELVYVKFTPDANNGEDVICYYTGGAVIKRMDSGKLCSLNLDYPFSDKSEDDNVQVVGRVLGTVGPDEIPDKETRKILENLLKEELRAFRNRYGET